MSSNDLTVRQIGYDLILTDIILISALYLQLTPKITFYIKTKIFNLSFNVQNIMLFFAYGHTSYILLKYIK
jgi:hypothetical protein